MNLENLKRQVKEAAQSDFLWGLGMRIPSSNQARKVCQALSLDLADEKRIKAVMRLRELDPQALLEIRNDAADEGEETMAEVIVGPEHFRLQTQVRDEALWNKIFDSIGIPAKSSQLMQEYSDALRMCIKKTAQEYKPCSEICSETGMRVNPRILHVERIDISIPVPLVEVIRVWPVWPGAIANAHNSYVGADFRCWDESNCASSFFIPRISRGIRVELFNGNAYAVYGPIWCDAIVSVYKKEFRWLAEKLARAYESETARRRKPAKTVVLKNY